VALQGLGTSTAKEAKEYFAKIDTHQIPFDWEDDERDANLIEMAFDKKRQKDRKTWLKGFKYVSNFCSRASSVVVRTSQ
jgi:DNA topoisomerase II